MGLLETIDSPDDLKQINRLDLPQLAQEIRQTIIEVVAKNGGHLAWSKKIIKSLSTGSVKISILTCGS